MSGLSTLRGQRVCVVMVGLLALASTGLERACAAEPAVMKPASAASTDADRAAPGQMIAKAVPQVYRLLARNGDMIVSGSAFLVSGRRVVATSHHVVEGGTTYVLGHVDAEGQVRNTGLRLLATYPQKDLALLETMEDLPGHALPLAADTPELGADLFALGFPAAADVQLGGAAMQTADYFSPSVVKGAVSRVMSDPMLINRMQHQAPITLGYSGGPLVDNGGVVVGVSSAVHKEASGIAFGVAAPDLANFLSACLLPANTVRLSKNGASSSSSDTNAPRAQDDAVLPAADQTMLRRADELFRVGDTVRARYLYEHLALHRQVPTAFEGLARTYDPRFVEVLGGVLADAAKAREMYERAGRRPDNRQPRIEAAKSCSNSRCSLFQSTGEAPTLACQNL